MLALLPSRTALLLATAAILSPAVASGIEPPAPISPIAEGAALVALGEGFRFTEGPAADRQGNVYFTDQPNDRILRWNAGDGTIETWLSPSGRANGLYFDAEGHLLACADELNQLVRIVPDRSVTVLIADRDGKLLNGPNDLWAHPSGRIYFTDPLYPRSYWTRTRDSQQEGEHVYLWDPQSKQLTPVATDLQKPNGIIGAPDGSTLYVSDIGAGRTYAYDIREDGSLANQRLFCELGSDGMTLDDEGNLYLTGRGVTVFDRRGRQIAHIEVPERWTANVTFGGSDRRTLFITASGRVYGLAMRTRGAQ
jgi:gluconolactonase